jgi:hypothetical protein
MQARDRARRVVHIPVAGRVAGAFKAGVNLCPEHADGTVTWEAWLAAS